MHNQTADEIIQMLDLQPHPEGGFYQSTYTGEESIEVSSAIRNLFTSIYFLLRSQDVSHFHRLKSDELWYFHKGSPIEIHMIEPNGEYKKVKLGLNLAEGESPQYLVPKNTIFGSTVLEENSFSLVGCMVAPGFDFDDFKIFEQDECEVSRT